MSRKTATLGKILGDISEAWDSSYIRRNMIFHQDREEINILFKYSNGYLWRDIHGWKFMYCGLSRNPKKT